MPSGRNMTEYEYVNYVFQNTTEHEYVNYVFQNTTEHEHVIYVFQNTEHIIINYLNMRISNFL